MSKIWAYHGLVGTSSAVAIVRFIASALLCISDPVLAVPFCHTPMEPAYADVAVGSQDKAAELQRDAAAYRNIGEYRRALDSLGEAMKLATNDPKKVAALNEQLGDLFTLLGDYANAKDRLQLAQQQVGLSGELRARIENDLGNLALSNENASAAVPHYQRASELASEPMMKATALTNVALAEELAGSLEISCHDAAEAKESCNVLADSQVKAELLLTLGQIGQRQNDSAATEQTYLDAVGIANRIGDHRIAANGDGYLSQLYESEKRGDDAMALARQAVFAAQWAQAPDILYRWQWQIGRLQAQQKHYDDAILSYKRATKTLESVNLDLMIAPGNRLGHESFRQFVGPIYFELADLLTQQAAGMNDPKKAEPILRDAISTVESLKIAELDDYFQDECASMLRSRRKPIEKVSPTTAIVYLIPLVDRTEILVLFSDGVARFRAEVTDQQLTAEVHEFRARLEDRSTFAYKLNGKRLYDWLITPLRKTLKDHDIDTLVFVPDGALRSIPMGALYDGREFLTEQYALAVEPGLTLLAPHRLSGKKETVLLNGLSLGVQREGEAFAALPHVQDELDAIAQIYHTTLLFNKRFVQQAVTDRMSESRYSIVHVASHAQFGADSSKTFIVTYDGVLSLDGLQQAVAPAQFRGQPIELLTLSACQTAEGDDRAALGLAGAAVKAGARSVLGTLWFINDAATSQLVVDFYRRLKDHPGMSKAEALRQAQRALLNDQRYVHASYWAPYLLIGNWL